MLKWYTNGEVDTRCEENKQPYGYYLGRSANKGKASWNKGLTKYTSDAVARNGANTAKTRKQRNNYISWNTGLTKETSDILKGVSIKVSKANTGRPSKMKGVSKSPEQRKKQSESMKGKKPWNKGLSKETDERVKRTSNRLTGRTYKWPQEKINLAKAKEYATKKKNNSFNKSSKEELLYKELCEEYGKDDVERQYDKDPRYPFPCDFYIKSKDLFIEYNGTFDHKEHPFDSSNAQDLLELEKLKQLVLEKGASSRYNNVIYIWTVRDVLKLNTFRKNHLNFRILYPTVSIIR